MSKIVGFEKLSLVDFDNKLASTIFFSGCNFRCPFCHNSNLVSLNNLKNINLDEILDYLNKRKGVIEAVCISGGEPTLNKNLVDILKKIKSYNLLIKLDTNGTNPSLIKELVDSKLVDYIAMDVKNSYNNYLNTVGLANNEDNLFNLEKIKQSICYLISNKVDYEFRITLVNEYHDKSSIKEIAEVISGAKRLYLQKFINNENCFNNNLHPISLKDALIFKDIFSKTVENVYLRGY